MACIRLVVLFIAAMLATIQPALAQSILRDAETEKLLDDMAAPIIKAAGLEPRNVEIVLVNDPSVNAFVAGGQAVYIHSGLINEASTANEVQGVIAHELGHVLLTSPDNPDASHHRGISEVEAESFAAMVCACYGMDSTGYTVPYVAGWAETVKDKSPLAVMRDTGERVRHTVLAELDHLPSPVIDDGVPPGLVEHNPVSIAPSARREPVTREAVGL